MSTVKAVKDAAPDPKAGKPRTVSEVAFPYYDLARSEEAAKVIHEKAGGECDRAQAAALLQYSGTRNGSFLNRIAAAKMFGLLEQHNEKLKVTPRALAIIHPVTAADGERARVEAFMDVELFRKVFEQFNGTALPEPVGLSNLFRTQYSVVDARVEPTVRIMLDSAETAGLFRVAGNRSRMVKPPSASTGRPSSPPAPEARPEPPAFYGGGPGNGGGAGGGGQPPTGTHRWILGLLEELPPPRTPLSQKRRDALVAAFTATLALIYPDAGPENGTG